MVVLTGVSYVLKREKDYRSMLTTQSQEGRNRGPKRVKRREAEIDTTRSGVP